MTATQFTPKNANVALRGNTARVCSHIANGQSRVGLTRSEAIANVRAENKRREMFAEMRRAGQSRFQGRRVALITRRGNNGFHVAGLGNLALTRRELGIKLAMAGFNAYRFRGLPYVSAK